MKTVSEGSRGPECLRKGIGFSQQDSVADQISIRWRGGYPTTRRGNTPEAWTDQPGEEHGCWGTEQVG